MKKIVIASNNAGKLREIRAILAPFGLDAVSQKEAGFDAEVEETGTTFAENAALKAHAVHEALHCAVIADDSGLLVDALDGAPGVYSHRFAGENATDAQRCEKLLELLKDTPAEKRTARFQCVLCYVNAAGEEQFFSGVCEGVIGTSPRGENGFGRSTAKRQQSSRWRRKTVSATGARRWNSWKIFSKLYKFKAYKND